MNLLRDLFKSERVQNLSVIFCLIFIFLVIDYTSGNRILNIFTLFHHHQEVNSWKIFEIQKNNLNPLSYDVNLPDLGGGRFVSFWDTPLPYLISIAFSKALFFLGDLRFLAAIKVTTAFNYFLSIVSFYALLRVINIKRLLALVFTFLLFSHRQNMIYVGFASINMPGIWAISIPIYAYFLIRKYDDLRSYSLLGISLALSYMQNPYYGYFTAVFLVIPATFHLLSKMILKIFPRLLLSFLLFLVLVITVKGPDIYKIIRTHPEDPESRNYVLRQVRVYRPWYHFVTPSGHFLENILNKPYLNLNHYLIDVKKVDSLLLWFPDYFNQSYLGLFNMLVIIFLLVYLLLVRKLNYKYVVVFSLAYLLGTAVSFRADVFFGSKHVVFPWYRLQMALPFTSLNNYSVLVVLVFYVFLAYLVNKFSSIIMVNRYSKSKLVYLALLIIFIGVSYYDTSYAKYSASCNPNSDVRLNKYLSSSSKQRLFIQLPGKCDAEFDPTDLNEGRLNQVIGRDARYYQIFHRSPIYATNGLTWFDNYRYDPPLTNLRTLESVLTDNNDAKLRLEGVQEIVLYTEFMDANTYWNSFLKPLFHGSKQVHIFNESIVFTLN